MTTILRGAFLHFQLRITFNHFQPQYSYDDKGQLTFDGFVPTDKLSKLQAEQSLASGVEYSPEGIAGRHSKFKYEPPITPEQAMAWWIAMRDLLPSKLIQFRSETGLINSTGDLAVLAPTGLLMKGATSLLAAVLKGSAEIGTNAAFWLAVEKISEHVSPEAGTAASLTPIAAILLSLAARKTIPLVRGGGALKPGTVKTPTPPSTGKVPTPPAQPAPGANPPKQLVKPTLTHDLPPGETTIGKKYALPVPGTEGPGAAPSGTTKPSPHGVGQPAPSVVPPDTGKTKVIKTPSGGQPPPVEPVPSGGSRQTVPEKLAPPKPSPAETGEPLSQQALAERGKQGSSSDLLAEPQVSASGVPAGLRNQLKPGRYTPDPGNPSVDIPVQSAEPILIDSWRPGTEPSRVIKRPGDGKVIVSHKGTASELKPGQPITIDGAKIELNPNGSIKITAPDGADITHIKKPVSTVPSPGEQPGPPLPPKKPAPEAAQPAPAKPSAGAETPPPSLKNGIVPEGSVWKKIGAGAEVTAYEVTTPEGKKMVVKIPHPGRNYTPNVIADNAIAQESMTKYPEIKKYIPDPKKHIVYGYDEPTGTYVKIDPKTIGPGTKVAAVVSEFIPFSVEEALAAGRLTKKMVIEMVTKFARAGVDIADPSKENMRVKIGTDGKPRPVVIDGLDLLRPGEELSIAMIKKTMDKIISLIWPRSPGPLGELKSVPDVIAPKPAVAPQPAAPPAGKPTKPATSTSGGPQTSIIGTPGTGPNSAQLGSPMGGGVDLALLTPESPLGGTPSPGPRGELCAPSEDVRSQIQDQIKPINDEIRGIDTRMKKGEALEADCKEKQKKGNELLNELLKSSTRQLATANA